MTFQFASLSDFFAMGGYGFYVWLSYGISFGLIALLIWQSKREIRQTLRQVQQEQAREERLKKQQKSES